MKPGGRRCDCRLIFEARAPPLTNSALLVARARPVYYPRMPRQLNVFSLPQDFEPDDLRGGIAVVIDVLRASTTMVTALANGARSVIPCRDVESARQIAAGYPPGEVLLGGERRGVRIEGFHLDNSPAAYSLDRVLG